MMEFADFDSMDEKSINLAPNHKWGLIASNPVLLAGGTIGFGEALHRGLEPSILGGVTVGPVMCYSRSGRADVRMAETNGGFVLNTGLQNRGIKSVLRHFAPAWEGLGCPVIVQVADSQPAALEEVVGHLNEALMNGVDVRGVELLLPPNADDSLVRALVRAAVRRNELPLWVKLPLAAAHELAPVAVDAGASGLVVAQPPIGALPTSGDLTSWGDSQGLLTGSLYGPLAFAPMMAGLTAVAELRLPCALIACGGIHTLRQAQQALQAGAQAIQLDSAVWVEPGLPARLIAALA